MLGILTRYAEYAKVHAKRASLKMAVGSKKKTLERTRGFSCSLYEVLISRRRAPLIRSATVAWSGYRRVRTGRCRACHSFPFRRPSSLPVGVRDATDLRTF